jgi:hypothetical protein
MTRCFAAFSIPLCLLSSLAFADITGHIADTVTHNSIANVTVTVIGTTSSAITDAQGNFTIAGVAANPVPYRPVPAQGFSPHIRGNSIVVCGSDKATSVVLFNSRGALVYRTTAQSNDRDPSSFSLPALAQGSFLLTITGTQGKESFRLMNIGGRLDLSVAQQEQSSAQQLRKASETTRYAVSCANAAYKTRELNVIDSGVNEIRLVPTNSTTYYYFPPVQLDDDGIVTGTLKDASINQTLMEAAGTKVLDTVGCHEIHSILVCKDSKLVFEEYFYGNNDTINFEDNVARVPNGYIQWSRTLKHYVASATKSFTSTVLAIALDKMGLTADEKISTYLPAYSAMFTGQKADITLKHCLNMVAGFNWNEWGGPDLNNMWNISDTDFTWFVLNHGMSATPGTQWVYCSGLPNIEQHIVQNMVGDSGAKFIRENLLEPLGITDIQWETQHGGGMLPEGAARLLIRPRDMLKWGITCLDSGKWQGKQVIPAAWLATCSKVQVNGNYSYHFWVTNYTYGTKTVGQFGAQGDGGNYILIFPTLNMVVVFTGGLYLESPTYDNQITAILTSYILPAVSP